MSNPIAKLFLFTFFNEKFKQQVVNAIKQDDGKFESAEIRKMFVKAAQLGHTPVVKLFLTVNKNLVDAVDSYGDTALVDASRRGYEDVVACLLTAGADVHKAGGTGSSPLWVAAHNGREGVVKQLLSAGADVNKVNSCDRTPLHWAACSGYEKMTKHLLAANAEITQKIIDDTKTDAIKKLLVDAKVQKQDVQQQGSGFVTAVRSTDNMVLVFKTDDAIAMACDEGTALDRAMEDLSIV